MEVSSSSASPNSGDKGRVCICFWYDGVFKFYIVDFDEDDNSSGAIEKSPAFQIHRESRREVFVGLSDPYLYVIGGVGDVELLKKPGEAWMSRYDLRQRIPSETTTVDITPSELKEGRVTPMKCPKFSPGITASPDGSRVVVYSRLIKYCPGRLEYFENDDVDFEVFDAKTQNWSQLPQLMLCTDGGGPFNSFYIKSSNSESWTTQGLGGHLFRRSIPLISGYLQIIDAKFTNGNTLLVTVDLGLIFTLNLDSQKEGWKLYGDERIPRGRLSDFVLIEPEPQVQVVLTPFDVKVVRGRGKDKGEEFTHQFPLSFDFYDIQTPIFFPDLVVSPLKYVENKECIFCIFYAGADEPSGDALLFCDLYKLDLVPGKGKGKGNGNGNGNDCRPIRLGSYRYLLGKSGFSVRVECILPFPVAIEFHK